MRSPSESRSPWWSARPASQNWCSSPMGSKRKRPSLRASEGSVLIQVLWTLAILVLLGLALGYTTALDQRLVSYQRDRLTALYLAKAGYVRALVELERGPIPQTDSYLDSWANNPDAFRLTPLGPGSFTVSYALPGQDPPAGVVYGIVVEDRKININTATKAILTRLPCMTEEYAITQNPLKVASSVFRIHAQGTVRDGKIRRAVEGVVRRAAGPSRSVALLSWRES